MNMHGMPQPGMGPGMSVVGVSPGMKMIQQTSPQMPPQMQNVPAATASTTAGENGLHF